MSTATGTLSNFLIPTGSPPKSERVLVYLDKIDEQLGNESPGREIVQSTHFFLANTHAGET